MKNVADPNSGRSSREIKAVVEARQAAQDAVGPLAGRGAVEESADSKGRGRDGGRARSTCTEFRVPRPHASQSGKEEFRPVCHRFLPIFIQKCEGLFGLHETY